MLRREGIAARLEKDGREIRRSRIMRNTRGIRAHARSSGNHQNGEPKMGGRGKEQWLSPLSVPRSPPSILIPTFLERRPGAPPYAIVSILIHGCVRGPGPRWVEILGFAIHRKSRWSDIARAIFPASRRILVM